MHPGTHAETPDKPAVIMARTGAVTTYAELYRGACQAGRLFASLGLRPGDHVAFQVENRPEFFQLVWAAELTGLVYTPISTRLGAAETAYIVGDCDAQVFVVGEENPATLTGLGPTPRVLARFALGDADGWDRWGEAVTAQPDSPLATPLGGADLLYSSGTTGQPKGVERRMASSDLDGPDRVTLLCQLFGLTEDTVYLSPAPLYHAAPLRFTRGIHRLGATVVAMEHFDPREYLQLVERYRVTASQVVPTMFVRMLKLGDAERLSFDVSSLEVVIHAAAPCPIPIKEAMIEWWGPILWEYYAGTEGNGIVFCNSEEWLAHKGTVGKTTPSNQVHILDGDGHELPAGQPGAIYFEASDDFVYRNDPEKTAAAHTPQGWSTLGDIGYLDAEGYLYLTDRRANMIISGGVNIYPQEAENLLTTHPKVLDVAVFGVPNEEMGEEVKAVVEPVAGVEPGPELESELIAFCQARLAHYKCPLSIDFDVDLPRHPTGKLYKRLLKDRYWGGHTSRVL